MCVFILFVMVQLETQPVDYEIQVPFDASGKITDIKNDLASYISFFRNYPDMETAILFLQSDSTYVMELFYKKDGLSLKRRIPLSREDLSKIRAEIIQLTIDRKITALRNRSGAWLYIINSFQFSYLGRAPLLLAATQPDDWRVSTTIYLLSSTAGFFIPLFMTKNSDITYSHAFMSWFGATRGAYTGWVISRVIDNELNRMYAWSSLTCSVIGDIAAFKAASAFKYTVGETGLITTVADWGTICIPGLLAIIEDWDSSDIDENKYLLSSLGGLTGGVLAGHFLTNKIDLHDGDPRIFRLYGILGAATPPAILSWFEFDSPNLYIASALGGCGIGSYLGWKVIKNNNYTFGDGVLLEVGSVAGAMATAGLLLLTDIWIDEDNAYSYQVYTTTALAGAMLGTAVTSKLTKTGTKTKYGKLLFHPEGLGLIIAAKTNKVPCKVPLLSFSF